MVTSTGERWILEPCIGDKLNGKTRGSLVWIKCNSNNSLRLVLARKPFRSFPKPGIHAA